MPFEPLGQIGDAPLEVAENEDRRGLRGLEHGAQRGELVFVLDGVEARFDRRARGRRRLDTDLDGVALVGAAQLAETRRESRREEHGLALRGDRVEQHAHLLLEAHVEHAVRLVEHEVMDTRKIKAPPLEVIDRAARRRDDDVDPLFEREGLRTPRLTAADDEHAQPRVASAEATDLAGDLGAKLAGRAKHEGLETPRLELNALEQRNREGHGLAAAGVGLTDEVAAREEVRQTLALDRREFLETDLPEDLFERGLLEKSVEFRRCHVSGSSHPARRWRAESNAIQNLDRPPARTGKPAIPKAGTLLNAGA